jgi:hypothetical protein
MDAPGFNLLSHMLQEKEERGLRLISVLNNGLKDGRI